MRSFFAQVEYAHRSLGLGMQNAMGRGIAGAANFVFLFMLVSGMFLWLPKSSTSPLSRCAYSFAQVCRAERANGTGTTSSASGRSIPLFFIVLTGVIMSYSWASNLLYTMTGTQPPASGFQGERGPRGNGERRRAPHGGEASDVQASSYRSIDELIQRAEQLSPGWKSITLTVPAPQDRVLSLSVDKSVGGQPEQAFQMAINRQSGNVEAVKRFSDNNTGRKLRAWARFLHTGEELGLIGQIIAAIACLGAILLVWTGISMALRRAFARFELAHEESESDKSKQQTVAS